MHDLEIAGVAFVLGFLFAWRLAYVWAMVRISRVLDEAEKEFING